MSMQRLLPVLAAAAALFAFLLPQATAQSVQLADGRVLLASVENADGEGLRVRRLDNGGMLDLRWDHLSTASATRWKKEFDLIGDAQDEVLVRATEVVYLSNGTRQTVIGRITDPSGDPLVVQAKGVPYPVPRRNLKGVRTIEVPATQVYTKEEFYTDALARFAPGEDANKHMLLAEELVKFRDYDRASEHLDQAKDLGNATDPARLDKLIDRLKRYKAAAKELGMIEQLQAYRSRGKLKDFQKGVELVATFEKEFPNSKLKAEFDRAKDRFDKARDRYLTQKVADQWRKSIQLVAKKAISEGGLTLQAARDFAENEMTDKIVERLVKSLELEEAEIKSMWEKREEYPIGKRTEYFAYGVGSWVLGEKEILKDTAAGKAKDKQDANKQDNAGGGNDRNIERFAKLLRQAMERRRGQAQQGGQREQTEEGWWSDASKSEQASWLRAYYAEYGGQLKVKFATAQQCISCYGAGTTPEIGPEGKMVRMKCYLCQNTKWVRSFKAY
ncbi:MAG: hypothetical protein ACE37K_03345 [Planctomycetota bacterium]